MLNKFHDKYLTFGEWTNDRKIGFGLGLFISKEIISKLSTDTNFLISSIENNGTKFSFKIFTNYFSDYA